MALDNLISISFSVSDLETIDKALQDIQSVLLEKTINLTPDERQQYGSIAEQNKLFVNKAKIYMEQYPQYVPNFLDKAEFDKDDLGREQVEQHLQIMNSLTEQLSDSKVLLDQDNYQSAITFYRNMKFLSEEIDSYKHFELLKKKLKTDFGIIINTNDVVEKNEPALSLLQFDDIYKAQIFFWVLKSNQIPSLGNLSKNKTNTIATNQTEEKHPINQILFGPPGTGKTYHTISKAVEIINSDFDSFQSRKEIKDEFRNLVEEGRIVFTTFHQSMSYEDFIEGIKPETIEDKDGNNNIIYEIKDGIFKLIADKAKDNWLSSQSADVTKLSFEGAFTKLKEDWEENNEIKFSLKKKGSEFTILGFTGKSIKFEKSSGASNNTLSINTLRDFYYGKREPKKTGVDIYYPSILDKLLSYSSNETQRPELQHFVIIIDEINRGNISQIFGELITLIEEDKRLGNDESLEITLPYSKEKFGVPPNLYIIGTMNTADKSVETLDTALRRRFSFEEMSPKPELLNPSTMIENPFWEQMKANGREVKKDYFKEIEYGRIDFEKLLSTINHRIEKLIDKEHAIGHAYFIGKDNETIIDSFYKNIIPLLQEYFFDDYGKIGLVLGKGFIKKKAAESFVFAAFDDYENEYSDRESYEIIDYRKPDHNYKIGETDMNFSKAVLLLMNQSVQ